MKPILCLDFDGVIHSYSSGWQGPRTIPDPPVPGSIDFLFEASQHFRVAIFSSRGSYWFGRRAMKCYIWKWAFQQFHSANYGSGSTALERFVFDVGAETIEPWQQVCEEAANRLVKRLLFPRHKPPAMVTLDDRAMRFDGTWPEPAGLLLFKPWNKRKV